MNLQSKAKIFLADERGCNETGEFRSYSTFNFWEYFNEHKYPFAGLNVLNDVTIAGGHSIGLLAEENSYILLLPVVGAVTCKINQGSETLLNAGQLQILQLPAGTVIELTNNYENELINFIHLWIKADLPIKNYGTQLFDFSLDENNNQLINITGTATAEEKNLIVSIGKFGGRKEAFYTLKDKQNHLFVFVIEGVFEVQGRLLHARDGLGLWDEPGDIELEALSNDAIVLMAELSKL